MYEVHSGRGMHGKTNKTYSGVETAHSPDGTLTDER